MVERVFIQEDGLKLAEDSDDFVINLGGDRQRVDDEKACERAMEIVLDNVWYHMPSYAMQPKP